MMIKNEKQNEVKKSKISKNNRILLIFVCIFLSVVLIFGAVFGIILAVSEANSVVKVGSASMDEGVVRVFASYYKRLHIPALISAGYKDAEDSETFWSSLHENGKTHGQIYTESLKNYLAGIAAGCDLFDDITTLDQADREVIDKNVKIFIDYYGSEEKFNEKASKYGFDIDDFRRAMEMLYTSDLALRTIYGYEGAALKAGTAESVTQCAEYLATYSHVKLIFISKDVVYEKNSDGVYEERELSDGEIAAREGVAQELRDAIAAKNGDGVGAITPTMFDIYLREKSDYYPELLPLGYEEIHNSTGYYFSENGYRTSEFAGFYPDVVKRALGMKVGEYAEAECDGGIWFIYRYEPNSAAYKNDEDPFFSDFYADAARYHYTAAIELLAEGAVFKDSFDEIDPISVPMQSDPILFVESWRR